MRLTSEQQLYESLKAGHDRKARNITETISEHADVNGLYRGRSPLCWARKFGNKEVEELLLQNGAEEIVDEELLNSLGEKLIEAARDNRISLAGDLLEKGADIDWQDKDGNTALMCAASCSHASMVRMLLDKDADVTIRNNNGEDALMLEAESEMAFNIGKMIRMGADINSRDNDGNTPVIRAARKGSYRGVYSLINLGSDLTLTNNNGENALDVAKDVHSLRFLSDAMNVDNNAPRIDRGVER